MNKLTFTKEADKTGGTYFFIRLNGEIVKLFDFPDQEDQAREFFTNYKAPAAPTVLLGERFLEDAEVPRPSTYLGNTIMHYRDCRITDKPYGNTPYTLLDGGGQIVAHRDEQTLEEMLDTIDVILDEEINQPDDFPPMLPWRKAGLEHRAKKAQELRELLEGLQAIKGGCADPIGIATHTLAEYFKH